MRRSSSIAYSLGRSVLTRTWQQDQARSAALPHVSGWSCASSMASTTHTSPRSGAGSMVSDALVAKFRSIDVPIQRYLLLRELQQLAPRVFYSMLFEHTEEVLPYIYTPTVGEACQRYHQLPIRSQGMTLSLNDRGGVLAKLRTWPQSDVRVVVMTDGERILGLGDLGANGLGISEGKILLYTAAAGVDPARCLPLCLDVGTNNAALLADPAYKGLRQRRPPAAEFRAFVDEVVAALRAWQPHLLIQFEDFANHSAFELLEAYRGQACVFNDDIQGTAAIALAGLLSAARATRAPLAAHRLLFLGAGEAGTGIGHLVAEHLHLREGLSRAQGRAACFFLDSKGLVCASRAADLQPHKRPFAHDVPFCRTLAEAVEALRPTALIGVSTIAGAFTPAILARMAQLNARPIVFPLSNPTSMSECTFEEARSATGGRVLFASGSPFEPLQREGGGGLVYPAQANNAYVFPALGMAAVLTRARAVTDEMFVVAAEELAGMSSVQDVEDGRLFPPFQRIREVSKVLAARIAERMVHSGLADVRPPPGESWEAYVARHMWSPERMPPTLLQPVGKL